MPLEIVTIEHSDHPEVLTQPAAPVNFPLSPEDQHLIALMKDLVIRLKGVGLAAPQIGVAKQIIVYAIDPQAKALRQDAQEVVPVTVLINPRYSPMPEATLVYDWEGCFSVKETTGKVPRYNVISYFAQTPEGVLINAIAKGFTARVLQHEIDHIQGVLITHRLTPDCLQGHPDDMMILRFQEFSPEQQELVKQIIAQREQNLDPNDKATMEALENVKKYLNKNE